MQTVNRPTIVLVLAIFHFIFGGMGIVCNMCGAGGRAMKANSSFGKGGAADDRVEKETEAVLKRKAPYYQEVEIGDIIVSLIASGVLIAAGIGLLLMKPWARIVSFAWAAVILLVKVFVAGYYIAVVFPALSEALRGAVGAEIPPENRQAFESVIAAMKGILLVSPCLVSIYAVTVFIVLLLPTVSAAFSDAGAAVPEPGDYHDRYQTPGQYPPGDYPR